MSRTGRVVAFASSFRDLLFRVVPCTFDLVGYQGEAWLRPWDNPGTHHLLVACRTRNRPRCPGWGLSRAGRVECVWHPTVAIIVLRGPLSQVQCPGMTYLEAVEYARRVGMRFPIGYQIEYVGIDELIRREFREVHPAFLQRFIPWLVSHAGRIGVGDAGPRKNPSNVSPASKRGRSFHQKQRFRSGQLVFAAVDCVTVDGPDGNHNHDGMTAELAATAVPFGLHANIGTPGEYGYEAWHLQCAEMDSYAAWLRAGRPDPVMDYPLPGGPGGVELPEEGDDMQRMVIHHSTVQAAFNEDGTIISDDAYQALEVSNLTLVESDHPEFLALACEVNGPAVAYELGKRAQRFSG